MASPSNLAPTPARGAQSRLAAALRPGFVYRREDLVPLTKAVDRHLRELVASGQLSKLAPGLYYAARSGAFGLVPPQDAQLVAAFLRDTHFLIFSASAYNSAGLGTTQLFNRTLVYNHKRHGVFKLGNRDFDFRVKPRFPKKLSPEFIYVDALNNLSELGEDQLQMLEHAKRHASSFDPQRLQSALANYGGLSTKKRVASWLHA
jgi:hypothetical protein